MPKTTKKVVKKRVTASPYTASIKLFGKVYTATGSSVGEAISKLEVGKVAKGASVLTITKGDISRSKILNAAQVMRLFSLSRLMHEVALKNVSMLFDF